MHRNVPMWIGIFMLLFLVPTLAAEPVIIRLYSGSPIGSVPNDAFQIYLDLYQELNPHITIENYGQEHNPDKLMAMFLGGDAPDIIEHDSVYIMEYFQRGFLAPVPERIHARAAEDFFPISTYSVTLGETMVGIPVENNAVGLWYSRQALESAGITEIPQDIEALERVAKRLGQVDGEGNLIRAGLAHSGDAPWAFTHTVLAFLTAEGGRVLDGDGQIRLNEQPVYRTVERLAGWLRSGDFFGFENDWRSYTAFHMGEVPFGIGYPWWMGDQRLVYPGDYTANFGVALVPGSDGYGTVHYGHAYGVNKASKHLEAVWELLEWLSLEMVDDMTPLGHYHAAIGTLPVHKEDIMSLHYADDRAIYEGFILNLPYARTVSEWRRFGADPDMNELVLSVVTGDTSPTEAIANMVRTLEADMQRHRDSLSK